MTNIGYALVRVTIDDVWPKLDEFARKRLSADLLVKVLGAVNSTLYERQVFEAMPENQSLATAEVIKTALRWYRGFSPSDTIAMIRPHEGALIQAIAKYDEITGNNK